MGYIDYVVQIIKEASWYKNCIINTKKIIWILIYATDDIDLCKKDILFSFY